MRGTIRTLRPPGRRIRSGLRQLEPCVIALDLNLPKHDALAVLAAIRVEPALSHISVLVVRTLAVSETQALLRAMGGLYRERPRDLPVWTCRGCGVGRILRAEPMSLNSPAVASHREGQPVNWMAAIPSRIEYFFSRVARRPTASVAMSIPQCNTSHAARPSSRTPRDTALSCSSGQLALHGSAND
jgi:CheY-like chemotaxis protein